MSQPKGESIMNRVRLNLKHFLIPALLVVFAGSLLTAASGSNRNRPKSSNEDDREKHLFVWAGDQARANPDFLAVIDFNEGSPNYGKVITTLPLPGPEASGNEPHHVGLSSDGNVLACGGLLSVLKGQKEIFFFDVSNPTAPTFLSSADPPLSAITDEFYALPNGGFLVTMMGGAGGAHPGRVAEFNKNLELMTEHPADPPHDGFNPHGISVRPEINLWSPVILSARQRHCTRCPADWICAAAFEYGSSSSENCSEPFRFPAQLER
jgi:selenium-binding protein 1